MLCYLYDWSLELRLKSELVLICTTTQGRVGVLSNRIRIDARTEDRRGEDLKKERRHTCPRLNPTCDECVLPLLLRSVVPFPWSFCWRESREFNLPVRLMSKRLLRGEKKAYIARNELRYAIQRMACQKGGNRRIKRKSILFGNNHAIAAKMVVLGDARS